MISSMVERFVYTERVGGSNPLSLMFIVKKFIMFSSLKINNMFLQSVAPKECRKGFSLIASTYAVQNWLDFNKPAVNWQIGFQTPASPTMEGIISFHDDLMVFLSFILGFVIYILYACITRFTKGNGETERFVHASTLEIIWTIIPAVILIIIAIPSFSLLYSVDEEVVNAFATFKAIGHQWYWSYHWLTPNMSKPFISNLSENNENVLGEWTSFFDSYMIGDEELMEWLAKAKTSKLLLTPYRLLTVDNFVYLPTEKNLRALVSSSDVLHSWALPSLGIKVDACPGRLNRTNVFVKRQSVFYGQCSEICGVNHGFMPIGIIGLSYWEFKINVLKVADWEWMLGGFQTL